MYRNRRHIIGAVALLGAATMAFAHGDVAPQPVNTDALPDVGEEWLIESPYRVGNITEEEWLAALDIGASGYNQNCARCHGLEAVSGGLAPDLRFLEAEEFGDEWYMERYIHGYTQNGVTRMPGFGDLLGQKAGWAIRVYIETRPDDEAMAEASPQLAEIRDQLKVWQDDATGVNVDATIAQLQEIADGIETLSGAPVADSVAFRAANILKSDPTNFKSAAETLTIGLSVTN